MKNSLKEKTDKKLKTIIAIMTIMILLTHILSPIIYADPNEETEEQQTEATEEDKEEIEKDLIESVDYTAYIKVCGNKKEGYYLNFTDGIDEKLQEKIDANPSLYKMYNITVDTIKTMIKAEISTKFPNFGEGIDVSDITGITGSTGGAASGTSHYNVSGEFAWPIAGQNDPAERAAAITSLRAAERVHPVFGETRPHEGMDIGVESGHEIIAMASGTVTLSREDGGYGNCIVITHDDKIDGQTWTSRYGHNTSLLVSEGTHVDKGQVVALAGSTGWSTGPHCHLQIEINEQVIDPLEFYSEDEVNGPGTGDYEGRILKGLKPKDATKTTNSATNSATNNTTQNANTTVNTSNSQDSNQANNTTNNNAGTIDVVAAAQKVHKIIENGYSYANDNSYETVEESEANKKKTVDCSTYVDWVLHEVGLNIDNRYCPDLQAELDSASWCTRVDQSQAQAGDIVLFYGHVQMYGGKAEDGSDMWYNAGSDEAILMSAPPGRGTPFSSGPVGIYHINNAAISSSGASSSSNYITNSNSIKEGDRENAFQGSVKMRRVTPNKNPGEFNTELGDKDYETSNREGEEGRGRKKDIPLKIQLKLKQVSCKNNTSIDFSQLQYLEIPYLNFKGNIKIGTMIVNKALADEVLDIFQELYNIKYPIENMQIIDNYYSPDKTYVTARAPTNNRTSTSNNSNQKNTTKNNTSTKNQNTTKNNTNTKNQNTTKNNSNNKNIEENSTKQTKSHTYTIKGNSDILKTCQRDDNAYSFYYEEGGTHATGNAIDINPFINPIVQNGKATSQTESRFLTRTTDDLRDDNERNALLTKESKVVKIFEKYGWTWGGNSTDSTVAYGHFEKPIKDETTVRIEGIESKITNLSFVPKDIFDALVAKNDNRALQVFTLDANFNVIVASWSYQNGQVKMTTGSTLNFRKGLNKYTMPVELLAAILIDSDDADFTNDLATLASNSEYVIAVEDNVTSTKTIVMKKIVEAQYDEEGNYVRDEVIEIPEEQITEEVTQKADVTYIDSWFVKMEKENTYRDVTGREKIENIKGEVERNNQQSATNSIEDGENNTSTSETTSSEITKISYRYLQGNYHVTGNSKKFTDLYNNTNKYNAKRNLYIPFLEDYLNQYESTVNQVDIMKYLSYQGKSFSNYGIATLEFTEEMFGPDDMTPSSSANGTGNASGTLNITGGNVEQKVWNALKSAGYTDVAVAAVMGNIYGESNFNPGLEEAGSGIGFGLCQWSFERRTSLEQFAASRGQPASNEDIQIEFLIAELTPGGGADGFASYQFGGYEDYKSTWTTTTDIGEATTAFCAGFERPSIPRNETRIEAAQGYLNQYGGH